MIDITLSQAIFYGILALVGIPLLFKLVVAVYVILFVLIALIFEKMGLV